MQRMAHALTDGCFDLLILGGGITGAGVALDAAIRGLRVALIDKSDFASGTSSVSSKLVHGGLRYLEHGDFRLVYEALHERTRLLHNAPHIVHPLRFVIPFYQGARVPSWKWRLGLTLYDLLAGAGNIHRSRPLNVRQLQHEFPALNTAGLAGGSDYYDAQMDDARLCIEVLRTAAAHGAVLANYVQAFAFEKTEGVIRGVRAVDHVSKREFSITARQVLNVAGPWVDDICRFDGDTRGPHLQPTKGVHLIVANRGLESAFLLLHPRDGRVLFVIPWLEGIDGSTLPAKLLIGTTDTLTTETADRLGVTADEEAYLLDAYNQFFAPPLSARDVLGKFAGLRPLIRSRPNEPSAKTREFRIVRAPSGLLSVAGGKYTTYRRMAEVITDRICRRLRKRRRCGTRELGLDGAPSTAWQQFAPAESQRLCSRFEISESAAIHLVRRYGRRASEVAALAQGRVNLMEQVVPDAPDLRVEFLYHRKEEMALRPADFLLRRTRLGLLYPHLLEQPPAEIAGGA